MPHLGCMTYFVESDWSVSTAGGLDVLLNACENYAASYQSENPSRGPAVLALRGISP